MCMYGYNVFVYGPTVCVNGPFVFGYGPHCIYVISMTSLLSQYEYETLCVYWSLLPRYFYSGKFDSLKTTFLFLIPASVNLGDVDLCDTDSGYGSCLPSRKASAVLCAPVLIGSPTLTAVPNITLTPPGKFMASFLKAYLHAISSDNSLN